MILTLLLNALFHHALFIIPQQEIPGISPAAYVMRHPQSGNVEVWWSPCPSRECPEQEEINVVVDSCIDHCLLLEQNPNIEIIQQPTKSSQSRLNNKDMLNDLNFKISSIKQSNLTRDKNIILLDSAESLLNIGLKRNEGSTVRSDTIENSEESWVAGSGESAFFLLDMHPDLGDPIEQLGIEIEDDHTDNVTDFVQRFGEKLLWSKGR